MPCGGSSVRTDTLAALTIGTEARKKHGSLRPYDHCRGREPRPETIQPHKATTQADILGSQSRPRSFFQLPAYLRPENQLRDEISVLSPESFPIRFSIGTGSPEI